MKKVFSVPLDGQFVAVWEFNENVWSGTFLWEDGELHEYDCGEDEWSGLPAGIKGTAWGNDSSVLKTTKFYVVG